MAGHRNGNGNHVGLAPEAPERAEYMRDFYSWLIEQARFVREGRWDALDRSNLAEEIESLRREQFNKLESALRVLLTHILKWDHQPSRRNRAWAVSIRQQRLDVDDVLGYNPGLKPRIAEALARVYRKARLQAVKETRLKESRFPEKCPYSFDEVVSRKFER
ncbi:MAG TPA: DUF29 domain-containing protein [Pseudolabrys sp.]|nr:DUF29 domain-containing protein [Pseudolabrys sp.]